MYSPLSHSPPQQHPTMWGGLSEITKVTKSAVSHAASHAASAVRGTDTSTRGLNFQSNRNSLLPSNVIGYILPINSFGRLLWAKASKSFVCHVRPIVSRAALASIPCSRCCRWSSGNKLVSSGTTLYLGCPPCAQLLVCHSAGRQPPA